MKHIDIVRRLARWVLAEDIRRLERQVDNHNWRLAEVQGQCRQEIDVYLKERRDARADRDRAQAETRLAREAQARAEARLLTGEALL